MIRYILSVYFFFVVFNLTAQSKAIVFGVISDLDSKEFVDFATIFEKGTSNAVESDIDGNFRIEIPADQKVTLVFSRIGYIETETNIEPTPADKKRYIKVQLAPQASDVEVIIRDSKIEDVGMVREEVTEFVKLPTTSGNFESVLPHIALGTSSGTGGELSSQYNVRGGNYDENLIYVNDFEIFRPQLIRSSQQEGLTFANIDLIRDLSFSSGGFQARYGDKLSSVLDVRYKRPDEFKGSVSGSLLGGSAHVEGSKRLGANAYNKFRYLVGARYKTTNYLLSSLDVTGEYVPSFTDIQGYFTYDISQELQVGFLGNFNQSIYNYIPESRSTTTGLINRAIKFTVAYEGQEEDGFTNGMGGVSLTYIPTRDKNPLFLKLLGSMYSSAEAETFDLLGYYRLSQIESGLGDEAGEEVAVLGLGLQHAFARNYLYSRISNLQHKGGIEIQTEKKNSHFIQWSAKYQQELIEDELSEWERLDSAGYSLPFDETEVLLAQSVRSANDLLTNRFMAYFQDTYNHIIGDKYELSLTAGVRANYWDFNEELVISPRGQVLFRPLESRTNITFKLAGGVYNQPPFYRELRRLDGTINHDIRSQKSVHLIAGIQKDLFLKKIGKKPFNLIAEVYYKSLSDLISYEVDNVRIRYSGENDASGYVMGLDFRINGEFVPGSESWVNISLLQAKETLNDVQHLSREIGEPEGVPVKWVPRPTDQLFNVSIFFQDYLPKNENFKMQLNMTFGSGLPFGIKDNNTIYRNTYSFKPYYRADIGFSYMLWDEQRRQNRPNHFLRFTNQTWVSLEVFNLMNVRNVASNVWVKTVGLQQYAIPNFLTSRRVNIRFRMDF